jgi:hypothetical protein
MRQNSIILLIVLGFLASCRGDDDLYIQAPKNKYMICRGTALFLNNGEKWPANKETTEGIDMMLNHFSELHKPADTASYHVFADSLMADYLYIINYCVDMGPAHEMIHSYLFPIQEMIVPMQVGGLPTCEAQYVKLQDYLARYHEYFE